MQIPTQSVPPSLEEDPRVWLSNMRSRMKRNMWTSVISAIWFDWLLLIAFRNISPPDRYTDWKKNEELR